MKRPCFEIDLEGLKGLHVYLDDDSPEWLVEDVFVGDAEIGRYLSKEAIEKIEKAVETKMQELRDEARIAAYMADN